MTTPFQAGDQVTWVRHSNLGTTTRTGTIEHVTTAEARVIDSEADAATWVMLDRLEVV